MIDLEKEEKEFSKYNGREPFSPDEDAEYCGWIARAELAQQEISELKAKLAKYESDDVILCRDTRVMRY